MTLLTTEKKLDSSKSTIIKTRIVELQYEKKSLWGVIAKNEIRVRTSSFRNHRKTFFILIYAFLFLWAFVIAPFIFDTFMPTVVAILI